MSAAWVDEHLGTPEFYADPYPVLRRLREEAPVVWSERMGGWLVTRYADVVAALRDPARFSNAGRVHYLLDQLTPEQRAGTDLLQRHYAVGVGHADPPEHTRLRRLLTPLFQPQRLAALTARVQAVVDQLLDAVAGRDAFDLVAALAYPLPAIVVLEFLGAPPADMDHFRRWAMDINGLFAGGGRLRPEVVAVAQSSLVEMRAYLDDLIAERVRQPRDDVISLLAADATRDRLDMAELVSTCVTLFVAGHETTTNLIGNGMVALLRHPGALAQVRADSGLMAPAIEEMLRYDAPVARAWRLARADVELGGRLIRQGQMVLLMLGAANRDPDQFADPETFDVTRTENRHLGFGYGIHFCLGAPLARIEAPIAIGTLLARFPALALDESRPLRWRHDIALRGVETLPVTTGGIAHV